MKRQWLMMYRAMRAGRNCQTAAGDYREWRARDFYADRPEGVDSQRWRDFCDMAEEEADCNRAGKARRLYRATYLNAGAAGAVLVRYGAWYEVSDYLGAPSKWVRIEASFDRRLQRCAELAARELPAAEWREA